MRFEQYERHTAWDRPGGVANRSGAGDLDVIIYSARKWARLGGSLRSIRRGERPLDEVVDAITDAGEQLARLRDSPAIPGQPDRAWVDEWLHRSYLNCWARIR